MNGLKCVRQIMKVRCCTYYSASTKLSMWRAEMLDMGDWMVAEKLHRGLSLH